MWQMKTRLMIILKCIETLNNYIIVHQELNSVVGQLINTSLILQWRTNKFTEKDQICGYERWGVGRGEIGWRWSKGTNFLL